jgi:hypothetical protein
MIKMVKFTLEQATKAQRGEKRYCSALSLTSALDGVSGQRHTPAALPPGKRLNTHCTGGWVGPNACLDGCGKSRRYRNSPFVHTMRTYEGSKGTSPLILKVPIHVQVWLASPAGLGFQWVKLVRVWSVTSRTLADYIYIRAWIPSQAPRADSRAGLVRVWAPLTSAVEGG